MFHIHRSGMYHSQFLFTQTIINTSLQIHVATTRTLTDLDSLTRPSNFELYTEVGNNQSKWMMLTTAFVVS